MYSFTKPPEKSIELAGQRYKVNFAFDNVIGAFSLMDNQELSDEEKINQCFDLLIVSEFPYDQLSIKSAIIRDLFKYLGKRPYGQATEEDEEDTPNPLPFVDFEQDAGAIYASFYAQYGIDLNSQRQRMHWDAFIALFDNLSSDTAIRQIIGYRMDDLTGYDDDNEGFARASELKEYYKLDKIKEIEDDETRDKFSGGQSMFDSFFNQRGKEV
jgi:hypothetical protein